MTTAARAVALALALGALGCATDPVARGRAALGRGDDLGAARWLRAAATERPGDPRLWRDLARAELRLGRLEPASQASARARDLDGADPSIRLVGAQVALARGDRTAALEGARAAAASAKAAADLETCAILLLRLGHTDEALATARRAVERSGGAPQAYTNLAVLAVEGQRPELAQAALTEGRARHPRDLGLAEAEAALQVQRGDLPAARRAYAALLSSHPQPGLVHQALALICHATSDLAAARHHAEAAVGLLGATRPDVHYTLVVILRDLGDATRARAELDRARRRFPHDPDLARLRAELGG